MARRFPEERYDEHGPVRMMVQEGGYYMVRRPGCTPFVLSKKEWAALHLYPPPRGPCKSPDCATVCAYLASNGIPCNPAREEARPADLREWAKAKEDANG